MWYDIWLMKFDDINYMKWYMEKWARFELYFGESNIPADATWFDMIQLW